MQFHFSAPRSGQIHGSATTELLLPCLHNLLTASTQLGWPSVALRRDRDQQVGHKRVRHRHHLLDIQLLRSTGASVPNLSDPLPSAKPERIVGSYRVRDELLEQALELGGVHGQGDRLAGEPTVDHGVGQLLPRQAARAAAGV